MKDTKDLQETIELKIDIPEGYEIDRENSTFECIKLKRISNRWRDTVDELQGFTIGNFGRIEATRMTGTKGCSEHGIFATEKIAKSALAMAQISQIMANDNRFGGVITDNGKYPCQVACLTGAELSRADHDLDLMMAPVKHEKWVNIYRSEREIYAGNKIYDTKVQAMEAGIAGRGYVSTSKIEWKEE